MQVRRGRRFPLEQPRTAALEEEVALDRHGKAVFGVVDRRCEHRRPVQRAVAFQRHQPATKRTWHEWRQDTVVLAVGRVEPFRVGRRRSTPNVVEDHRLGRASHGNVHVANTGCAGHEWLDHVQCGGCCHGCINGVAALLKHGQTGCRRQWMRGRNGTMSTGYGWSVS